MTDQPLTKRFLLLAWLLPALVILTLFLLWTDNAYSDLSDGVYLYISRAQLNGQKLYSEIVCSLPPPLLWFGSGVLAINDSLAAVRIALALIMLATSGVVLYTVWRLTENRWAAAAAGLLYLVTLYTLKEKAALVGESLQAPTLLLAALLASRKKLSGAAGAIAAFGIAVKLTFLAPACILVFGARSKQRYLTGLLLTSLIIWTCFYLIYGDPLFRDIFSAQSESGLRTLGFISKLVGKGLLIELPLLALIVAGYRSRSQSKDPELYRACIIALIGGCLMLVGVAKEGTDSYLIGTAEPLLAVLAVVSLVFLKRSMDEKQLPKLKLGATLAAIFMAGEILLFLISPHDIGPIPNPITGRNALPSEVDAVIARINKCPADAPYAGPPYYAFLTNRRMVGNQGDPYLFNVAGKTILLKQQQLIDREYLIACPAGESYRFKHY